MKIDVYTYDETGLEELRKGLPLPITFSHSESVPFSLWGRLEKAKRLASEVIKSLPGYQDLVKDVTGGHSIGPKPSAKFPSGSRWITIHPHGKEDKGVPVLIQESGDGTAHIIAGAGGKLNMMKLNRISTPEEAKKKIEERKRAKQEKLKAEQKARAQHLAELRENGGKEAVTEYLQKEKARKQGVVDDKENAIAQAYEKAKELLSWQPDPIVSEAEKKVAKMNADADKLAESGDDEGAARLRMKADKVKDSVSEAVKRQMTSVVSQAKAVVTGFKRDIVKNADLQTEVEARLKAQGGQDDVDNVGVDTESVLKKGKSDHGLGFKTGYGEKANLSDEELAKQKKALDESKLDQIEQDHGVEARVKTENLIKKIRDRNAAVAEVYQRKEFDQKVEDLDKKVELLKAVSQYEKAMKEIEGRDLEKQKKKASSKRDKDLDDDFDETTVYGDGVAVGSFDYTPEQFVDELKNEAKKMELERQAMLNGDFLEAVKKQPGAGKWIANGVYQGFNGLSQEILKGEAIPRDVVDVLGVGPSAKLLAFAVGQYHPDDLEDIADGVGNFHAATNETLINEASERGKELLDRAENLKLDEAKNAGDLQSQYQLNETRLEYVDEAHRILGQTLGTLEAQAALAHELKGGGAGTIDVPMGAMSNEDLAIRMKAIGLEPEDWSVVFAGKQKIARLGEAAKLKLIQAVDPEEVQAQEEIQSIKNGDQDQDGWLPAGIVSRPFDSFADTGAKPSEGSLDEQSIGNDDTTREALHRTLGEIPEGRLAYTEPSEFTPQDQTDLRRYWEQEVYKGSGAEASHGSNFYIGGGKGTTKSKEWAKFVDKSGGRAAAVQNIKDHLASSGEEDMFGEKTPHPLSQVDEGALDRYRENDNLDELKSYSRAIPEVKEHIENVQSLKDNAEKGIWFNPETRDWENAPKKALSAYASAKEELPGKLKYAHDEALRNHYHDEMSGLSASDYITTDDEERDEGSPWGEYVRMHGDDPGRALETVQDILRGRLNSKFAENYSKVGKIKLKTGEQEIRNKRDHLLGMLSKEDRDNYKTKAQAALAEAGATVANRGASGKFGEGGWRDKAYEFLSNKDKNQLSMFDEDELKQDDGTRIPTLGKKVQSQLAQILPEASANQRRGERYQVSPGMSMSGKYAVQQRAVKMFERAKRMNLTFGTGQGKSITSIGSFTNLHDKGLAKRAIFAVPSVVQGQFGGEMAKYTKPGSYRWKADPELDQSGRIAAMKDPKLHMTVFTHQSLRDDMVHLMATHQGVSEAEAKSKFNSSTPKDRSKMLHDALKHHGINYDMAVTDEAHYATNRAGKEDSTLSNVLEALSSKTPYVMNQSATPVKNDVSEAWDMIHKVDPDRYPAGSRDSFLSKYGVDTDQSAQALRRIISRYNYASPTVTGVKRNMNKESVELEPEQQKAYDKVNSMFKRASTATKLGKVDTEAMKYLSPNAFEGRPEEEHEGIAKRLQSSAGIIKEEALNRVVNSMPAEHNAKLKKLMELAGSKIYTGEDTPKGASKGQKAPGVVFAHNLSSVNLIKNEMEKNGYRVGVIHGGVTGADKEKIKKGFNPQGTGERKYDMLVLSDAGATGLNLQNAKYLVNYDLPQTSWVKEQREGRIDRHGQAHKEIDYHDLVTNTEHEKTKWDRIQRKAALGQIFQQDDGFGKDDTGVMSFIHQVKHDRAMRGDASNSVALENKGSNGVDERSA